MIWTRRVYETPKTGNGQVFLVERLWPRGFKKENLHMDAWLKDVAPSQALRQWYAHDVAKWDEFQRRYRAELDVNPDAWQPILAAARKGDVILLYSARDTEHNSATVLKEYVDKKMAG